MPHIREVRWLILYDKDGTYYPPELQQRNGKYGTWEDVPTVKRKSKEKK